MLAPSWRSRQRTRPERLRRMCHRASASDQEELAWVAGRGRPQRETTKKRRLAECTSASLLGLAEAPGKQQFEPFLWGIPVDPHTSNCGWGTFPIRGWVLLPFGNATACDPRAATSNRARIKSQRIGSPRSTAPLWCLVPGGILTVPWLNFPFYQNVMHRISGVAYSVSMWAFHRAHSADAFLASVGGYS